MPEHPASGSTTEDAHLHEVSPYDELKEIVQDGWALIWHCGTRECEDRIKEETKASSR